MATDTDVDHLAEAAGPGSNIHPMDQFIIEPLFGDGAVAWYTPTNATLWMAIAVLCTALLLVLGTRGRAIVPSRVQSLAELAYGFVHKMVEDVAGREGLKYFPYIMTLFMFIVFANMLGLVPMSFAPTSHIAVTAFLALAVFITVTVARLRQERVELSRPLLGHVGAAGTSPGPRDHRAHQLLRAPGQPLHPTCRQHHGGPRRHQGLCRVSASPPGSRRSRSSRSPRSMGSSCWWPSSRPMSSPS